MARFNIGWFDAKGDAYDPFNPNALDIFNSRQVRNAAEIPAAGGISEARALARIYAACVGEVDGVRLIKKDETVLKTKEESSRGPDLVLVVDSGWGMGFMRSLESSPMLTEESFWPLRGWRLFSFRRFGT